MIIKCVGLKRIDMRADDGKYINGYSVFVTHPEEGIEGEYAEKLFLGDNYIGSIGGYIPRVGDLMCGEFTRSGKLKILGLAES